MTDDYSSSLAVANSTTTGAGLDNDRPDVPHAAYNRMKPRWEKCRACFLGTEAIRAGGKTYLPQHGAESDARYGVRRDLAAFYNGYARTVLASVGMLLETEPTLNEDMPSQLVELAENIDARGTHLAVFARKLATAGIIDAYAGILVEYARRDDPSLNGTAASLAARIRSALSLDDEKRLGLRPYFLLFKADDVYRPIYEYVNGIKTRVLQVFREIVDQRIGTFGIKTVTQYRVYTNSNGVIEYQLWREPDGGGRPTRVEGPTRIENQAQIPWVPFIAGEEIGPDEYKPPLLDLADLNLEYHQTKTNILSLEAQAMVPTPVRIGAERDPATDQYPELVLGPGNTIEVPLVEGMPQQPVYWLSPDVDVLVPAADTLTRTEAAMGAMGMAFLSSETRAAETAEGKRIDSAAQRATLASVSRALKDCLEGAFGHAASYLRLEGGSVTLNDNFTGVGLDPAMANVMMTAYQENVIDFSELRHFLKTGQLPEGFDAEGLKMIGDAIARRQAEDDADIENDDARSHRS